jgi:hypothetical protein
MRQWIARVVIVGLVMQAVPVGAQTAQQWDTGEPVSRKLAWAGLTTAVVGFTVLGPWGDQYSILGDQYCVTEYAVYADSCLAKGKQLAIGSALLGGGIVMMWAGLRTKKVRVSPSVGKKAASVQATIVWGGKR